MKTQAAPMFLGDDLTYMSVTPDVSGDYASTEDDEIAPVSVTPDATGEYASSYTAPTASSAVAATPSAFNNIGNAFAGVLNAAAASFNQTQGVDTTAPTPGSYTAAQAGASTPSATASSGGTLQYLPFIIGGGALLVGIVLLAS